MAIQLSSVIGSKIPFEVNIDDPRFEKDKVILHFNQLTQGRKAYLESLYGAKEYYDIFLKNDLEKVVDILFYLLDQESKKEISIFRNILIVSPPKLSFKKHFYRLRYWLNLFKKTEYMVSSDREIFTHIMLADPKPLTRLICKVNGMPDDEILKLENLPEEKKSDLLAEIAEIYDKAIKLQS